MSKKTEATDACKDILGAKDADSAKKVVTNALKKSADNAEIKGEVVDANSDSAHLQCDLNGSATRFFPSTLMDDEAVEGSVTATANGFGAEAHSGSMGPGMQNVIKDAVGHLKP